MTDVVVPAPNDDISIPRLLLEEAWDVADRTHHRQLAKALRGLIEGTCDD